MSKKQKYIKPNNMPPRLSILWPIVWWLVLERFNAPGWVFGAIFTVIALLYAVEVWRMFACEAVDLVGNDDQRPR